MWRDDAELFALLREKLFTAVVGDILDGLGFTRQFLPPGIQPLDPAMTVAGRAMPVLEADYPEQEGGRLGAKPFGLMLEALDDLKPGEVYVATGGSPSYALWGELMSTRAMKLGAAGAVLDGYSRDTRGILKLGFPVFSRGRYAQDQRARGKVVDFRLRLEVGGVTVRPGDIVFGDLDGVVVVPREAEAEVFRLALEKASTENRLRTEIAENGMAAAEAFRRFGVM
ncbi:MAG TPA: dimethylmenaquinone methyltransferase [Solibacterales bacterium]|nr:dimethylmenaquinone methyltransferase [Bryobacterales bacterium]